MSRRLWILGSLMLPFGADPYHAACLALDSANKTVYLSDPFETECSSQVAACLKDVTAKWSAFLKKENVAQTPGATVRCQLYKDGSTPNESPRSRVRKWRDEEGAQATMGGKHTKTVNLVYEPN